MSALDESEIEVTPEMVEAGIEAACVEGWLYEERHALATSVYLAMERARLLALA